MSKRMNKKWIICGMVLLIIVLLWTGILHIINATKIKIYPGFYELATSAVQEETTYASGLPPYFRAEGDNVYFTAFANVGDSVAERTYLFRYALPSGSVEKIMSVRGKDNEIFLNDGVIAFTAHDEYFAPMFSYTSSWFYSDIGEEFVPQSLTESLKTLLREPVSPDVEWFPNFIATSYGNFVTAGLPSEQVLIQMDERGQWSILYKAMVRGQYTDFKIGETFLEKETGDVSDDFQMTIYDFAGERWVVTPLTIADSKNAILIGDSFFYIKDLTLCCYDIANDCINPILDFNSYGDVLYPASLCYDDGRLYLISVEWETGDVIVLEYSIPKESVTIEVHIPYAAAPYLDYIVKDGVLLNGGLGMENLYTYDLETGESQIIPLF